MDECKTTNITFQTIDFNKSEKEKCLEITDHNVAIVGSPGKHDHGSSKVKLKNIVDYKWEQKNYTGRLIATHMDGIHIAYRIKVNNNVLGITERMIRVVNLQINERTLIKGMSTDLLDLQFAHISSEIILACIEETDLHIYKINSTSNAVTCELLLKIHDALTDQPRYDKINWCPYVPEKKDDIDDCSSQLIVWMRGSQFQYYSVSIVIANYGTGVHNASAIKEGCMKHINTSRNITGATFSPDGTTLAISSDDGYIRFFQVYMHSGDPNPRCLHEWKPHQGKAISCLFFLDNHVSYNTNNSLWKHALTGADNNTELKLWSCETWECIQTITFKGLRETALNFKIDIDRTSAYVILSEMNIRQLYVLQILKENDANTHYFKDLKTKHKNKTSLAFIKSVAEFPLSSPILSFGIVDAAIRRYKCGISDGYLIDELDDYDEENNSLYCVVIKMFIVQPKSLQECHILYQPTAFESDVELKSTLSFIENQLSADTTNDDFSTAAESLFDASKIINSSLNRLHSPKLELLSPDTFTSLETTAKSPAENVNSDVMRAIIMMANGKVNTDMKAAMGNIDIKAMLSTKGINEIEMETIKKSAEKLHEQIPIKLPDNPILPGAFGASGHSSPSREVQEILSLKDSEITEYFGGFTDVASSEIVNDDEKDEYLIVEEKPAAVVSKVKKHAIKSLENNLAAIQPPSALWPIMAQPSSIEKVVSAELQNHEQANSMENLNRKFDEMMELVQSQSCMIVQLQTQIHDMQKVMHDNTIKTFCNISSMEEYIKTLFNEYFTKIERELDAQIKNVILVNSKNKREVQDDILRTLPPQLCDQIVEKMALNYIIDFQRLVLPVINAKLDTIKPQLQLEVNKQLMADDKLIRDSITQMFTSKNVCSLIGDSICTGVKSALHIVYLESLKTTIVPAYERYTKEMFLQIRQTFIDGTKDLTKHLESYITQIETRQTSNDEFLAYAQILPQEMKSQNDKFVHQITNRIANEFQKHFQDLQGNVTKSIKDNIEQEIEKGFANQTANFEESVLSAVRSQAQTPAPSFYDVQEQIKILLSQNHINKAFHHALLGNDLNLVEFTIERADFKTVFNPCPLEQKVLLSLIQQITADMNHHSEIKQKYLSEAILNLDFSDTITKDHGPKIMKEVYQKCQQFILNHSSSPLCSSVKMLLMAVQGIGHKAF